MHSTLILGYVSGGKSIHTERSTAGQKTGLSEKAGE
jgi:hypothetical protein